tara:strand:- start:627 stop:794 length:168 start_codon:yes stop_codon:yes gene_type:complete
MKQYTIKLKKRESEEHSVSMQNFASFPEAATWAYLKKSKLGQGWYIQSISEKLSC